MLTTVTLVTVVVATVANAALTAWRVWEVRTRGRVVEELMVSIENYTRANRRAMAALVDALQTLHPGLRITASVSPIDLDEDH